MKAGRYLLLVQTLLGFLFPSMNFRSARHVRLIQAPDYLNGPLNQATQCFAARWIQPSATPTGMRLLFLVLHPAQEIRAW